MYYSSGLVFHQVVAIKSYNSEKICLIFEKGGEQPINSKNPNEKTVIRFSVSENYGFCIFGGWEEFPPIIWRKNYYIAHAP